MGTCLFTSAGENIDFPWLHEVMFVLPEGPESNQPEVELVLTGLVRSKKEGSELVFVHRGEIYSLKNRSSDWLSINNSSGDWITNKILNHKYQKVKSSTEIGKYHVRPQPSALSIATTVSSSEMLGDIEVYCSDETFKHMQKDMPREPKLLSKNPIFSLFSVTFPSQDMFLFRISFRTRFGLRDYHSQIGFDVQGPDLAMDSIRQDIVCQVSNVSRTGELWQKVGMLYKSVKTPQYEVAIVSHPLIALSTENMINTEKVADFSMETEDTDIKSAASPTRVICFDINRQDVLVQAVAGIIRAPGYYHYSKEFLDDMNKLMDDSQI